MQIRNSDSLALTLNVLPGHNNLISYSPFTLSVCAWLDLFLENPQTYIIFFLGINNILTPGIFSSLLLGAWKHSALASLCAAWVGKVGGVKYCAPRKEAWTPEAPDKLFTGQKNRIHGTSVSKPPEPAEVQRANEILKEPQREGEHHPSPRDQQQWGWGYWERCYLIPLLLLSYVFPSAPTRKVRVSTILEDMEGSGVVGGVVQPRQALLSAESLGSALLFPWLFCIFYASSFLKSF